MVYKENYNRNITIEEIPYVLNRNILFKFPEDWKIKSIQKIDDGFVSPSVKIKFYNKIILDLLTSEPYYPKMKKQIVLIDKVHVILYKKDSEVIYVFKKNNIYYSLQGTTENADKIQEYIKLIN
jgi:hypothetical protein